MVLSTALLCLALNVYHEARGESFKGQVAVADVTMNRSYKTGESVCQIVSAYKQFSWLNGSFTPIWKWDKGHKVVVDQRLDPNWIKKSTPDESEEWENAKLAAHMALYHMIPDVTHGSTYYHAVYVNPKWKHEKVRVAEIGQHIFYRNKKQVPKFSLTFLKNSSKVQT